MAYNRSKRRFLTSPRSGNMFYSPKGLKRPRLYAVRQVLESMNILFLCFIDWNGKHGQICQSSKSSYICSLDVCLDGNWIILYRLVLRVWGDLHKIYPWSNEGASHQCCGIDFHGTGVTFSYPLGWHLCIVNFNFEPKWINIVRVVFLLLFIVLIH